MSSITIYHNPRCSKSRQSLELLREHGEEPKIIEYLKDIPTREELQTILAKLNLNPTDILRTGEQIFKEKFKSMQFSEEEWLEVMIEYPKLIERPIVVKGNRAVVGRPPERVLDILE